MRCSPWRVVRPGFTPLRVPLRRGFTLIELLIIVGLIGILASIVIVAVNPARQLSAARNAKRRSHLEAILNAVHQHAINNRGVLASGIQTNLRMLGTGTGDCTVTCGAASSMSSASPTTVTLYPEADASLYQTTPTANYGSNAQLWIYPWTPSWTRRALIRFDLSSLPAGATITVATLNLREATTYGSTRTIGLYRLTRSWTETGVTWNRADASTSWTSAGGDAAGSPSATATISWDGILGWDSWNVQSDVQAFMNGSQTNHGWLMRDTIEDSSQAYWFFYSKEEDGAGDLRPYLSVTYTTSGGSAPSTASGCLNLRTVLVPAFFVAVPQDPVSGTPQMTYYAIQRLASDRVLVHACAAELGETIELSR